MLITAQQAVEVLDRSDCLYTENEVANAIDKMSVSITEVLGNTDPIVLCIMQGGLIPAGLLLSKLRFPLQVDYIHATRYAGNTQGGDLTWIVEPSVDLAERTVLLVDDILDEGITLAAIKQYCQGKGADVVLSATLVNKLHDRKNDMKADFVGLDVEDRYVFGCGMDYKGYLRNISGIYAVNEDD
ncbi:MAG: hypoxanthine-guanine phosphoribosyltransferase [Gammaproteobacteria bacterium]